MEEKHVEEGAAALRMAEDMVATVAHDIRGPLAGAKLRLHAVRRIALKADPPELAARIEKGMAQVDRLLDEVVTMADTLLDASLITSGMMPIVLEDIDPRMPIRDAVEEVLPTADIRDITLHVDVPEGPCSGPIHHDRNRIRQVLCNLIGNAVKFAPMGSTVTLRVTLHEKGATYAVESAGPTIPPEERNLTFEKFHHRSKPRSPRAMRSHGMGLWIAKWIVEAHGGRIWAEGPLHPTGDGNRFSFELPRKSV